MRPYAPMSKEDVQRIQEAKIRARALSSLVEESLRRGLTESARVAQRDLEKLHKEIYQKFDIRL